MSVTWHEGAGGRGVFAKTACGEGVVGSYRDAKLYTQYNTERTYG